MFRQIRRATVIVAALAFFGVLASAQGLAARKLGPDTLKSIGEAKLDPAFQTTKLDRIVVLPFANAGQYKDAANIISKNFVSQLSQMHSEYKFLPPDEMMNFISSNGLNDDFNVFLGDYLTTNVAGRGFLDSLRSKVQADAVLVGHVTKWGEETVSVMFLGRPMPKKLTVVGLDMSLYRTTDGRCVWYGKDLIAAPNRTKLQDAAEAISEVFARYFGRVPY